MRIERTGPVERLTPQVIEFLSDNLHGISLDEVHSAEAMRVDYSCLGGRLAVELKSLEESGQERVNNLAEELRLRDDWPIFLGSAPMQSFIANMNDPEGIQKKALDRIGRNFINHMKKANRQLAAHSHDFPRKNMLRLLVFVNEDHELFDPHTVSYILWHAVRRHKGDAYNYEHIDAILYLTQRHAAVRGSKLTYPVITIEGLGCYDDPWKSDFLNFVVQRWVAWNGYDSEEFAGIEEFTTIDHIPDQAPRYERWHTEYLRSPYLRSLSKEELHNRFDEVAMLNALLMLKNSPVRFSQEQGTAFVRQFGDLMVEMGERAIPITEFQHSAEREESALSRLGMPTYVATFLANLKRG